MMVLPRVAFVLAAFAVPAILSAQADQAGSASISKVRIVRLSEVRGDVEINSAKGNGFEPAIANLPVVEQSELRTRMGAAEVEFEDNSTLRVGTNTVVEFPELGRTASGSTVSTVRLLKGTLYVSLLKARSDQFTLDFGDHKITLPPASHIRLEMTQNQAVLAVLDGSLQIDGQSGPLQVTKKKSIAFDLNSPDQPKLSKLQSEPLDEWDQMAARNHARVAAFSAFTSPYAYGLNDMAYYGSFVNSPGCGSMWRPYFASAAWDPYSNGAWAWYAGSGYSWVSPYPWGWTPYHYGSWSYCDGTGWGWMPGGSWNGLNNVAMNTVVTTPTGSKGNRPIGIPVNPVHPPRPGAPTILAVNTKPLVRSAIASPSAFEFRRDSAGLGVPRDTLGNLSKFSQHTVARGSVSTPVYLQAPPTAIMAGQAGVGSRASVGLPSMHRGYAPAPSAAVAPPAMGPVGGGRSAGNSGFSPSPAPVSTASPHVSTPGAGGGGGGPHH